MVSPAFHQHHLIGFFACTAHVVDIGGRGFSADAASIYEEGLRIPIMKFAESGQVDTTLVALIKSNVREPEQVVGDIYALASCNEIGQRRLLEMMQEYGIQDLCAIAEFILENSHRATVEKLAALPQRQAEGVMRIDGYDAPIDLCVSVTVNQDHIKCDFTGSSPVDKKGINVPLVYTQAYACYALKCAIAPEVPNNAASLAPFVITAPEHSIVNALHPAPVALRHVIGHMIPDAVFAALDKILPQTVPAEGAGTLCNFQASLRPRSDQQASADARRAEVLTFNSGGAGARPTLDGMNATAFPSGVMTMPVEATEHAGPIVIWRKELRCDSGGAGQYRGGLGQNMDIEAAPGHEFDFSAMFDRVDYPARGRAGGLPGAATSLSRGDGTALRGKGKQFIAAGERVKMGFPGGAGYGEVSNRTKTAIKRDLANGYISVEASQREYGLDDAEVVAVQMAVNKAEFDE